MAWSNVLGLQEPEGPILCVPTYYTHANTKLKYNIYIYEYICCMYIYTYIQIYVYMYVHICMYVCMYACMYTYVCMQYIYIWHGVLDIYNIYIIYIVNIYIYICKTEAQCRTI